MGKRWGRNDEDREITALVRELVAQEVARLFLPVADRLFGELREYSRQMRQQNPATVLNRKHPIEYDAFPQPRLDRCKPSLAELEQPAARPNPCTH
jgi:hypothetical protein